MPEERIAVFIDGSNFYHSTAKQGKKLEIIKLIRYLIGERKLVKVYYYVAPLDIKLSKERYWAHQKFIDALRKLDKFEVILCSLKKIKINNNFVYVVKGDDIRLSNNLIIGALDDLYDTAIIVSGDEDFIDSIKIVRERFNKRIGNAYFRKSSSYNLRKACDFSISLDRLIE